MKLPVERMDGTVSGHLPITNNFVFCKVMSDKTLCKTFLESVLKIKIDHLSEPVSERYIAMGSDNRSVRYDVYTTDDNTMFDIEMQMVNEGDLPQRVRFYQAINDVDSIKHSQGYRNLKASVIIFLCPFDLFHLGLPCYTFVNTCREYKSLELGDNTMKIFYNFKSYDKIEDRRIQEIMEYFAEEKVTGDISAYMDELQERVHRDLSILSDYYVTWNNLHYEYEHGVRDAKAEDAAIIAEKDSQIAEKDAEIARLKALLEQTGAE